MNPHARPCLYIRNPQGGIDVGRWYREGGIRTFYLTMQSISPGDKRTPFTYEGWEQVIADIRKLPSDAVFVPWAWMKSPDEIVKLRELGLQAHAMQPDRLDRGAAMFDLEKCLDRTPSREYPNGATCTIAQMVAAGEGLYSAFTSIPWPFSTIADDYKLIPPEWHVEVQLFVRENSSSQRPRDCRARYYEYGTRAKIRFQFGIEGVQADELPRAVTGRQSLYPADAQHQNAKVWLPRDLEPLPESVLPYAGPFYGPDDPKQRGGKGGSRHPVISDIKWAWHRAGYVTLNVKPDDVWNRNAVRIAKIMQHDLGIDPTGNWGRGSWEALRRLASANPGETYAYAEAA